MNKQTPQDAIMQGDTCINGTLDAICLSPQGCNCMKDQWLVKMNEGPNADSIMRLESVNYSLFHLRSQIRERLNKWINAPHDSIFLCRSNNIVIHAFSLFIMINAIKLFHFSSNFHRDHWENVQIIFFLWTYDEGIFFRAFQVVISFFLAFSLFFLPLSLSLSPFMNIYIYEQILQVKSSSISFKHE